MQLLVLTIVTIVVLHIAGPFPSFLELDIVSSLRPGILFPCLAHGIIEEYLFRHLFWKNLKKSHHVGVLIWINVLAFWLVHVLLLYYTRIAGHERLIAVYESTTYNLSIVFAGIMLNVLYLESNPFPLAACVLAHTCLLLLWTLALGGDKPEYYAKYNLKSAIRTATQH